MPSLFIGIYVALYPYTAQTEQEISVEQGDLLYLLEKSQEDDWWKVKKRVLGAETEEPVGLVPNNYVQQELSFKEDEPFNIYDNSDPDWILVGDSHGDFGFVPSNYVEQGSNVAAVAAPASVPVATPVAAPPVQQSTYVPPPPPPTFVPNQSKPLPDMPEEEQAPPPNPRPTESNRQSTYQNNYEEEEEDAPPLPSRPTGRNSSPPPAAKSSKQEQFYTWAVQEVDGRKKYKATLSIANGSIMFSPGKSAHAAQQWPIDDLIYYNQEKKHVFLEFQHPTVSLDLHAGSKETAEEITSILGEFAGANKAAGLREVITAAKSAGQKMGKVLYDFEAQGDDEVSVKEGENIFILDSEKSTEWWMVRNASGKEGVVPSSYVEVAPEPTASKRLSFRTNSIRKNDDKKSEKKRRSSLFSSSGRKERQREKEREEQEREQEEYNRQQERRRAKDESRSKPDPSKVRTWVDRTGTFKVEAQLLGCIDGKIHLHKLNGVKIAVAASKMSIADLEYVERKTGVSLEDDKPLASVKRSKSSAGTSSRRRESPRRDPSPPNREPSPRRRSPNNSNRILTIPGGVSTGVNNGINLANAGTPINNVSTVTASAPPPSAQKVSQPAQPEYDWFGFFLECGVDISNCQRYAINFNRDQMDESVLEDITPPVLRTLGLKEGDILRVTKKLDEKFSRRKVDGLEESKTGGGLFSGPGGTLKNNTSKTAQAPEPVQQQVPSQQPQATGVKASFDDDAWAVKNPPQPSAPVETMAPPPPPPAAPVAAPVAAPAPAPPAPVPTQPTGALKDFLDFKPLEPVKTAAAVNPTGSVPNLPLQRTGAAPLNTTLTGNGAVVTIPVTIPIQFQPVVAAQPVISSQPTGGTIREPLGPFATGVAQVVTGGPFAPLQNSFTGSVAQQNAGFVPAQNTGFVSSTPGFVPAQNTGFFPVQSTGFVSSTPGFVPAQNTGFVSSTPGFVPTQVTGGPFANQPTGGPFANQPTGGPFVPQQQTGFASQSTGALMISQITGGASGPSLAQLQQQKQQQQPQPSFGAQFSSAPVSVSSTGFGQPPATSFGQLPVTSFGQPPVTSFGQPAVTSFGQPAVTTFGQPAVTSFAQQQPVTTFGQPINAFGQPQQQQFVPSQMTSFNAGFGIQQQPVAATGFGQPPMTSFGQPTGINGLNNQFQQMNVGGNGFGYQQPLQNQPTGFGFGNVNQSSNVSAFGGAGGALQPTPTGRRANLAAATPQNPFGF
ncbi:hypothetical protein D0Z00_002325 [Geotrichum galactomycetum]|uniref:Uncharacterized protein n=1 Tax=Geotrichum galactomycetum TaxID=27317 RepID=A0ACB6V4K7_9ASCO|nr:hypothetical protein D0Z00_002325 [Geotrichum candidum]